VYLRLANKQQYETMGLFKTQIRYGGKVFWQKFRVFRDLNTEVILGVDAL